MLGWEAHSSTVTTVPVRSAPDPVSVILADPASMPLQRVFKEASSPRRLPTCDPMDLHPDLVELAPLVGTWRGEGHGTYPTIEPFDYTEEVVFATVPTKPFLVYRQRTADATSGEPLHAESGYLRAAGPGRIEMTVAQPTGIAEVHAGTVSDGAFDLRSQAVVLTPTAKEVVTVHRHLVVEGDVLRYRLEMGAMGQPHQLHLEAELRRVDS